MQMLQHIKAHFYKDYKLEVKDGKLFTQLLVYMVASVFVCFIAFGQINTVSVWASLYWLIVLFGAFQLCGRSFDRDTENRLIWSHILSDGHSLILAKLLFNVLFLVLISLISCFIFWFVFGFPSEEYNALPLILSVLGGAVALAASLTLISALAFKAGNALALSSILGFPVVLPAVMLMVKTTAAALNGMSWEVVGVYHYALWGIALLGAVLTYLLFPYFWRD